MSIRIRMVSSMLVRLASFVWLSSKGVQTVFEQVKDSAVKVGKTGLAYRCNRFLVSFSPPTIRFLPKSCPCRSAQSRSAVLREEDKGRRKICHICADLQKKTICSWCLSKEDTPVVLEVYSCSCAYPAYFTERV